MSSVDVGIGHDDYLMISQLVQVEVLSDTAAESCDHVLDFIGTEYLVKSGFFNVQDLTSQRKDGLTFTVTSVLGGTACGISLDQENLREFRILF